MLMSGKKLVQFYINTLKNFSDDPSRHVDLRDSPFRGSPGDLPEGSRCGNSRRDDLLSGFLCLELFGGAAGLTSALQAEGLPCGVPYDCYPKKKLYLRDHDLTRPEVADRIVAECERGAYFYVHLGIVCSSFTLLTNLNGGTRTLQRPEGTGTNLKEEIGNVLAEQVLRICAAPLRAGHYFSIENPAGSYLWKLSGIVDLLTDADKVIEVVFDQCCFNLLAPVAVDRDAAAAPLYIKKPTKIVTNMKELAVLGRRCIGEHVHLHCMGGVKTSAGWVRISAWAQQYGPELCRAWAAAVRAAAGRSRHDPLGCRTCSELGCLAPTDASCCQDSGR